MWVTNHSGTVYGHVIAADAFEEILVVPIEDIFKDICKRLPADKASCVL